MSSAEYDVIHLNPNIVGNIPLVTLMIEDADGWMSAYTPDDDVEVCDLLTNGGNLKSLFLVNPIDGEVAYSYFLDGVKSDDQWVPRLVEVPIGRITT